MVDELSALRAEIADFIEQLKAGQDVFIAQLDQPHLMQAIGGEAACHMILDWIDAMIKERENAISN